MSLHSNPPAPSHSPSQRAPLPDEKSSSASGPEASTLHDAENDDRVSVKDRRESGLQQVYNDARSDDAHDAPPETLEVPPPPPPPPDFAPFYTLITDPGTGALAHPTVHYVFADDDPDILTSALLASVKNGPRLSADRRSMDPTARPAAPSDEALTERYVIIDMSEDGKRVVSASSLAPDWQALTTSITPAPSWRGGGDEDDEGGADKGLMLKISGQENGHRESEKRLKSELEALMQAFDRGLADLAGVVDD